MDKIWRAIKEINSNANFSLDGTNIDDCTIEWLNGTTAISKDNIKAKMQDIEDNGTVKDQKKASGKQKLKDLGLDDDEIQALMGV